MAEPVVLRDLLREKHWQKYQTFQREYDKAAASVDQTLVGTAPSRAQLHRWQAGELKGLPHPQHCEVLEAMFPGHRAAEMFIPSPRRGGSSTLALTTAVEDGLDGVAPTPSAWSAPVAPAADPPGPLPTNTFRGPAHDEVESLARALQLLGKRRRIPEPELAELALLAGHLVDLEMECTIDIEPDGWAAVTYRFELLNLTAAPVKRLLREQWFENTDGVRIEPHSTNDRQISIQRLHDIGNMTKFACVLSPPIEPGGVGTVSYTSRGGRFVHDHYWQQTTPRHARHLTLTIRHRGVDMLVGCTAVEDQPDGAQVSAIDDLLCVEDDDGALITLARDYLQPGQFVTIRWEVARGGS
jgi:hypothetical protein